MSNPPNKMCYYGNQKINFEWFLWYYKNNIKTILFITKQTLINKSSLAKGSLLFNQYIKSSKPDGNAWKLKLLLKRKNHVWFLNKVVDFNKRQSIPLLWSIHIPLCVMYAWVRVDTPRLLYISNRPAPCRQSFVYLLTC
jgi:hypothetical protein